jgi:hypothetical protein
MYIDSIDFQDINYCFLRISSVGMATSYGVRFPEAAKVFYSATQRPDRLWGTPSLLSNGYKELFLQTVNRPEREADHSPPQR